jgi:hypothetical protein
MKLKSAKIKTVNHKGHQGRQENPLDVALPFVFFMSFVVPLFGSSPCLSALR